MKLLLLIDGSLYDLTKAHVYPEADYFADVEEAQRWIGENGQGEKVLDGRAR